MSRMEAAESAFSQYDMGDMIVKDTGSWNMNGDEWNMPVFIENGDEPSVKLIFVVRFNREEVREAYFGE